MGASEVEMLEEDTFRAAMLAFSESSGRAATSMVKDGSCGHK